MRYIREGLGASCHIHVRPRTANRAMATPLKLLGPSVLSCRKYAVAGETGAVQAHHGPGVITPVAQVRHAPEPSWPLIQPRGKAKCRGIVSVRTQIYYSSHTIYVFRSRYILRGHMANWKRHSRGMHGGYGGHGLPRGDRGRPGDGARFWAAPLSPRGHPLLLLFFL